MSDITGAAALILAAMAGGVQLALASRSMSIKTDNDRRLEKGFRQLSQCLFGLLTCFLLLAASLLVAVAKDVPPWIVEGLRDFNGVIVAACLMVVLVALLPIFHIVWALWAPRDAS